MNDSIHVVLQDLGYHRWDLKLVEAEGEGGWDVAAMYTTTVGGGERVYENRITASACDGSED